MTALLLAPHNDDETLFAAYTCMRERPLVLVCLRSVRQSDPRYPGGPISFAEREAETACAMSLLGCQWQQSLTRDDDPDWAALRVHLQRLVHEHDLTYAPAVEEGGHPHHNVIGIMADEVFQPDHVIHYATYTAGRSRTLRGTLIEPSEEERALKLAALSCYASQIACPSTAHHFTNGDVMEEYLL